MQTITFGKGKLVSKLDNHRVNLSLLGPKYNWKRQQKSHAQRPWLRFTPVGCQTQWSIGVKDIVRDL
jgi:hypothetical protein